MIYLASSSPRRRELLRQIGIRFETLLMRAGPERGGDVDETPLPDEVPEIYVKRIAAAKAASGWARVIERRIPPHPVLAADTAVILQGKILGKPEGQDAAIAMLTSLSGREHEVLTAVSCACQERTETLVSRSIVRFCEISEREIKEYAATGEALDKAGAYAIQGRAALFVERLEGSYSGVMGLPLYETGLLLKGMGEPWLTRS